MKDQSCEAGFLTKMFPDAKHIILTTCAFEKNEARLYACPRGTTLKQFVMTDKEIHGFLDGVDIALIYTAVSGGGYIVSDIASIKNYESELEEFDRLDLV